MLQIKNCALFVFKYENYHVLNDMIMALAITTLVYDLSGRMLSGNSLLKKRGIVLYQAQYSNGVRSMIKLLLIE